MALILGGGQVVYFVMEMETTSCANLDAACGYYWWARKSHSMGEKHLLVCSPSKSAKY